jgi:hypothetical protein
MASYKISPAGSVYATGAGQHAFNLDSKDADTLVVDPSAFLIAAGAGGNGAILANTKPWQATINGSIISTTANGLVLNSGNSGTSKISIGTEGSISADIIGVSLNSAANLTNAGTIKGYVGVSIENAGAHVIKNTGTIYATDAAIIDYGGLSNDTVTNSGTIRGVVMLGGGNDVVTNSGLVSATNGASATIELGTGNDKLTNSKSGSIGGNIDAGDGNDIVANSGFMQGSVELGIGDDKFTNSGQTVSVHAGAGEDSVTNSGYIYGLVDLGGGDFNSLVNSGLIDNEVRGGGGNDKVINSGTIYGGVILGDGNNYLSNSGHIAVVRGGNGSDVVINTGIIGFGADLGGGDDTYIGGTKDDFVFDDAGSDKINLGGGDDGYIATNSGNDGNDTIDGGSGADFYEAAEATGAVRINLDNVAHDLSPFDLGGLVAANSASGVDIGKDTIKNFEHASGGKGSDFLYGNAAANVLTGDDGYDVVFGFAGNDELWGGDDDDWLAGGAGRDDLYGGTGYDTFYYASTSDSGVTVTTRDRIGDFENGIDLINLQAIDANTATKGMNEAFTYIGTNVAFTKTTGELRGYWTANGQIVEGDVNGDGRADFSIELTDPNHAIALDGSDFLL